MRNVTVYKVYLLSLNFWIGFSRLHQGDFEQGVEWAKRSLRQPARVGHFSHATLANLDRMEEAREALQDALQVKPNLSIAFLENILPTRHKDGLEIYLSGIRKAGLT